MQANIANLLFVFFTMTEAIQYITIALLNWGCKSEYK